jgi:hypothetical protein
MHSGLLVLLRTWLIHARPWQQLLAGAIVAGIGVALAVLGHLGGVALVIAGLIVARPAITVPLHRTRAIISRAFPARGSQRPLTEPGSDSGDCAGDRTPEGA